MKFLALATLVATALAVPAPELETRQNQPGPCTGDLRPQCCEVNVLGLAALQCKNPTSFPTGPRNFEDVCRNKAPKCCPLVLLNIGVLCQDPIGVNS